MSPDALASAAAMARLLAEIGEDRAGLARRLENARDAERRLGTTPSDAGALALAAVALHGWYTGLEAILERVARQLDGSLPAGERWHRELLFQMSAEIPGARPPVLDVALVHELGALLAFRHFFRHAYAVDFDPEHVTAELSRMMRIAPRVDAALDALTEFLRGAMARLGDA